MREKKREREREREGENSRWLHDLIPETRATQSYANVYGTISN